jgi:uncharacterized protein (TIGR02271 family)
MTTRNDNPRQDLRQDGPWRLDRVEERLHADTRPEIAGEVRIDKDVVEEQRTLDVPLTHDEVEVRRFAVDAPAGPDALARDGDRLLIPLEAERLDVTKEARVVEEVEVAKTRHAATERVTETVRREEIDIDVEGDVVVHEQRG